jgi:hypothetical protein
MVPSTIVVTGRLTTTECLVPCGVHDRAHLEPEVGSDEVEHVVGRGAAGMRQVLTDLRRVLHHPVAAVEQHARWAVALEQRTVEPFVADLRPCRFASGSGPGTQRRAPERRPGRLTQRDVAPLEQPGLLVDDTEQIGSVDRFRRAEEQHTARLERVVEQGDHVALRLALQVDQQVPTRDEIGVRERRVAEDVMLREHDHVADDAVDLVVVAVACEEPMETVR